MPFVLFVTLGFVTPWLGAVGATRYVDANTCHNPQDGSAANPYCKIQDAICVAVASDTVSVARGTYLEAIRMKPGVSVISQSGAADTTINAANQPCTDTNYCAKKTGTGCSVVTFASGHTTATRLEGFTVTGGAGTTQTNWVAGGGIYLFSPATIVNNVITNNVLSGPRIDYRGAGVFVYNEAPVITGNTITNNRAIPGPGTSGAPSTAGGGGIWAGYFSSPVITNNIIQGNRSGDPNVAYSFAYGGGVLTYPPASTSSDVIVDRNLIADNYTDSDGGGIALLSHIGTGARAVVTNNVIVGNESDKWGGGVYTYFNRSSTMNNTITGNKAFLGGGVFSGQGDATLPVQITNNIIEGNRAKEYTGGGFGTGGGIYSLDLSTTFSPSIVSNDLFGNVRTVGGSDVLNQTVIEGVTDNVVGTFGNFSSDPRYVNKTARNFHLDPNSPAIDRANAAGAPPVDRDGIARGFDGNGVPNNPSTGDIDVGAYERAGSCIPATEVCDGLDNNCNLQVDEGFTNTDGDSMANCIDPDDDNDTWPDAGDCAPLDAGSGGMPQPVTNVDLTGPSPTQFVWDTQNIGPATHYEIVSGLLSRLSATGGFSEDFCRTSSMSGPTWNDTRPAPPPGDGWFFLLRAANACGLGTLGSALADMTGSGDVCQTGVVDADSDGSPSDLDCNESNPTISPLQVEICDGLDNNCTQGADEGNPGGGVSCGVTTGQCEPGLTACSGGSLSCVGGVGPATEVCDGLDNNCDGFTDENQTNTDGDSMADCVDPDDDNDGAADAGDCAPLNAGAYGVPVEVSDLDVLLGSPTQITWQEQSLGSGTQYEVATGQVTSPGILNFSVGTCVGTVGASPASDFRSAPAPDTAWYYMVKSRNACGAGTYGTAGRNTHPACP